MEALVKTHRFPPEPSLRRGGMVRVLPSRAHRLRARRAARLRFGCGLLLAAVLVAGVFRVAAGRSEPRPGVQVPESPLGRAAPAGTGALMMGQEQGLGVWVVEGLGGRMLGILRGPDRDAVSTVS